MTRSPVMNLAVETEEDDWDEEELDKGDWLEEDEEDGVAEDELED